MKRVVVNASVPTVSSGSPRWNMKQALNHLKKAQLYLEEVPNDSEFGEFSSYLDEHLRTLIQETATELEI